MQGAGLSLDSQHPCDDIIHITRVFSLSAGMHFDYSKATVTFIQEPLLLIKKQLLLGDFFFLLESK